MTISLKALVKRIFTTTLLLLAFSESSFATDPKWTFFVFLNGHNNLDLAGHSDIAEMIKGMKDSSDDRTRIIVQWASLKNTAADPTKGVQRIEITKSGIKELESLGKVDMGDIKTLDAFLKWGIEKYPTEEIFVDVWDHGSGWKSVGSPRSKAVSVDDLTGNMISTEQLSKVFNDNVLQYSGGKKIVLGFDACLQAACELSSEFQKGVKFMIASTESEPGAGWPYDAFLKQLHESPVEKLTPEFVGETIVKTFIASNEGTQPGTLSVIDLQKSPGFEKSINDFVETFKNLPMADKKSVMEAMHLSLRYTEEEYVDLGDFMNSIISKTRESAGTQNADLIAACEKVNASLKEIVVYNGTTTDMAKSSGLSIWLPNADPQFLKESERYKKLQFDTSTNWSIFIDEVLDFQSTNRSLLCDLYLKQKHSFLHKRKSPTSRRRNASLDRMYLNETPHQFGKVKHGLTTVFEAPLVTDILPATPQVASIT